METTLRFFPVSQVSEFAACIHVAQGEREKSNPLFAEGFSHPLNVLRQCFRLLSSRPRERACLIV